MSQITSYELSLSLQSGKDSAFKWTQEWLRKFKNEKLIVFVHESNPLISEVHA